MKLIEKKEIIEKTIKVYVAKDGKEFNNENDCLWWEKGLKRKEAQNKADRFRIKEMDDCVPIHTGDYMSEESNYKWYKIENEADFQLLQKAYDEYWIAPKYYPEIICVEDYCGDYYPYNLSEMFEITKSFWKDLGYEVMFERNDY